MGNLGSSRLPTAIPVCVPASTPISTAAWPIGFTARLYSVVFIISVPQNADLAVIWPPLGVLFERLRYGLENGFGDGHISTNCSVLLCVRWNASHASVTVPVPGNTSTNSSPG